ncbi:MAG: glycosyltransferase family 2 protein [Candidatus Zhuqueibacterota bacterium]
MNVCVIIPAYNAETTIGDVIRGVKGYVASRDIVVIDDGSTDGTAAVARESGAILLHNETNRGKGYSLRHGFNYALEHSYEAVISLDADMQHDPREIPKFVQCYIEQRADLVLGDRTHDFSAMPLDRQFSNKTTSLLISLFTGQRVRDSQNGYRLMTTESLRRIHLTSDRYEMESELLVKLLIQKCRLAHVPIKTIYGDQKSHIHRGADTLRFIRIVTRSLLSKN